MSELETAPTFDVISHIVYAAGRENVTHLWVNGRCLMNARTLTTLDETELKAVAKKWQARISN
jgi:5-methylthioadenosine/S-adenosylhomocysteine deaminase